MQDAEDLAEKVLHNRLTACVNIIPHGKSMYLWDGKVEKSEEYYVLFKTNKSSLLELELFIIKNHPYEIPAIIKLEAESSAAFLEYINNALCKSN